MIRCFISSIEVRAKSVLGILAVFKARPMSERSRGTEYPCQGLVADMLKIFMIFVAASNADIRLLPLQYSLL